MRLVTELFILERGGPDEVVLHRNPLPPHVSAQKKRNQEGTWKTFVFRVWWHEKCVQGTWGDQESSAAAAKSMNISTFILFKKLLRKVFSAAEDRIVQRDRRTVNRLVILFFFSSS